MNIHVRSTKYGVVPRYCIETLISRHFMYLTEYSYGVRSIVRVDPGEGCLQVCKYLGC